MFNWFTATTVAQVTAQFDKMITQLENVMMHSAQAKQEHLEKIDYHTYMKNVHDQEFMLANRVKAKIKEIIS